MFGRQNKRPYNFGLLAGGPQPVSTGGGNQRSGRDCPWPHGSLYGYRRPWRNRLLDVMPRFTDIAQTLPGILFETPAQKFSCTIGHPAQIRLFRQYLRQGIGNIFPLEQPLSREQFVEQPAESPNIRPPVDGLS